MFAHVIANLFGYIVSFIIFAVGLYFLLPLLASKDMTKDERKKRAIHGSFAFTLMSIGIDIVRYLFH